MLTFTSSIAPSPDDRDYMMWLYEEFHLLMFYEARKVVTDQNELEDIVQDSIVRLMNNIGTLREKKRPVLAKYIGATVHNTAVNRMCRNKRDTQRLVSMEEDEVTSLISDFPPPYEIMERYDEYSQLRVIWELLTETERYLLEGKYILELTDAQLAQSLGCKAASIRTKLSRARKHALLLLSKLEKGTIS